MQPLRERGRAAKSLLRRGHPLPQIGGWYPNPSGLRDLVDDGVTYQLRVDKGISTSPSGDVGAQVSGDLSQFQPFAITIEPGQQQLPTSKPILVGNLQGGST